MVLVALAMLVPATILAPAMAVLTLLVVTVTSAFTLAILVLAMTLAAVLLAVLAMTSAVAFTALMAAAARPLLGLGLRGLGAGRRGLRLAPEQAEDLADDRRIVASSGR